MSAGTELRQVRLEAIESVGQWFLRITLTSHDEEGFLGEPEHWSAYLTMPDMPSQIDQAWVVLVNALHLLEAHGSDGSIRHEPRRPATS